MQFELDKAIEILSRTPEVIAPLLLDLSGTRRGHPPAVTGHLGYA